MTSKSQQDNPYIDDRPFTYKYGPENTSDTSGKDDPGHEPRSPINNFLWPEHTFDIVKQQWTGIVESINGEEFTVRMQDSILKDAPEEVAILSVEDLPMEEKVFLDVGSSFVWTIGRRADTPEIFSKMLFRRLPRWSKQSIDEAEKWGKEAFEKINNSNDTATF